MFTLSSFLHTDLLGGLSSSLFTPALVTILNADGNAHVAFFIITVLFKLQITSVLNAFSGAYISENRMQFI